MYTHVQNVFLHYHYQELLFPYGYHTMITENSVPFLGLREDNSATAQEEGKWHLLAANLCCTECNSAYPHLPTELPWDAGNPREKLSAWKRITGSQLAQSKVMGMSLFISSWAAVHFYLSPARRDHSGHGAVKHKGMASLRLLECFKVTAW